MKKILSLILLTLFSTQTAFASIQATRFAGKPEMDNCTFYADYTDGLNGVNADFSVGSPQATFTRTCSATNPATYIDASGVIQLVTTNNAPRYSQGYYDTTGFHAVTGGGLLVEQSKVNDIGNTNGVANSGTLWTNWSEGDTGSDFAATVVAIPELTGITSATSQRFVFDGTATAASGTFSISTKTLGGFVNGDIACLSAYVRSQTGVSSSVNSLSLRMYWKDGNNKANGAITTYSLKSLLATGSTTWKKISTTATMADITKTITNIDSDGTTVTVTCSAPHALLTGSMVSITGTTNYNDANVTMTTTGDTSVFTYPDPNTTNDAAETTGTVTNKASFLLVQFYYDGVDTGEAFDFEVACPQAEKGPYPTSWIPTGSNAALTRSADVLKYLTASNRTAATETIAIKSMALGGAFANDSISRTLLDSDTDGGKKQVVVRKGTTATVQSFFPNLTDSSGTTASATTTGAVNTSYTSISVAYGASAATNAEIYIGGATQGTDTDDYTAPSFGTSFYVGGPLTASSTATALNGLVQKVAIFSEAKSSTNVGLINTILT